MTDKLVRKSLTIQSLTFKENNKWRLVDADQTVYSVAMKDEAFLRQVNSNEVAFAKEDTLVCDLRIIQWDTSGDNIQNEYEVIEVISHTRAWQPPLGIPPDDDTSEMPSC